MKRIIKITYMVFMLIAVPFSFVISSTLVIRGVMNKPLFYPSIGNYNCNQYNWASKALASFDVTRIKYAKIKENCFIFKTSDVTNSSFDNIIFILPESYFVVVLSEINSMISKVQYKNKIGYVSSDSILKVDFVPVTPYLSGVTFDVYDTVGTQLRSSPEADDNSNVKMVIPAGSTAIEYVASVMGAIPTGGSSNVWYYCVYTPISDPTSVYEGYVYSEKTTNMTNIPINTENAEGVVVVDKEEEEPYITMNNAVKIILIVLICVPVVLVFVLLVLQNKRNKKEGQLFDNSDKELSKHKNDLSSRLEVSDSSESSNKNVSVRLRFAEQQNKAERQNKITKIKDLKDKKLEKKTPYYAKFVSANQDQASLPAFPTYEIIDDDDLL